jgi:hypothetical protein
VGSAPNASAGRVPVGKIRYVLDFGPTGAKTVAALDAIDGWLSNGSKYSGAIMIRPSNLPVPSVDSCVTAIEIEVKLYEIDDPNDEVTKFVLGRTGAPPARAANDDVRLTLSGDTRRMVSGAVRSALGYALGESGRDVVLSRLQLDYGFGFSEVTDFPGRFMELLNEILQGGSRFVEERMLQELRVENPALRDCGTLKEAIIALVAVDAGK